MGGAAIHAEEISIAAALSLTESEAEEHWRLQGALDESRRALGNHGVCNDEDDPFEQIRRQSLIESLPREIWIQRDLVQECALCLEDFSEGGEVTRLDCLHVFHND